MVRKILLPILLGAFLISGCHSSRLAESYLEAGIRGRNPFDNHSGSIKIKDVERDNLISSGKTTKEELRAMFGEPAKVGILEGGMEKWQYYYTNQESTAVTYVPVVGVFAGKTTFEMDILEVLINADGIVENYSYKEMGTNKKKKGGSENSSVEDKK